MRGGHCLEVFAGHGGLTAAWRAGGIPALDPLEAYPGGVYCPTDDLLSQGVVQRLHDLISSRRVYYVHFGTPCSSFSVLNHLNGGTRCQERPEGTGVLETEVLGNRLADITAELCEAIHVAGGKFSIENPSSSWLWSYPPIKALNRFSQSVVFDQCEYGLHIEDKGLIKKPTTLLTNMAELSVLSRKCSKHHEHLTCCGSVRTSKGWKRVSVLAGRYPTRLCSAWARAVGAALSRC